MAFLWPRAGHVFSSIINEKKQTMKKLILLIGTLFFTAGAKMLAQVEGISYTLSPTAEHTWWDDHAGLADGYGWGGKLGLAFGENLELRGTYFHSSDLKTDFSKFGLSNFSDSLYSPRNIDLVRWGGEVKANLGRGALRPFLTTGAGVQSIEGKDISLNKNIFASFGGGLKLSPGERFTITLEAKNTIYNSDAGRHLLTPGERETLGLENAALKARSLANWSAVASLQFYLGGRKPGDFSALDEAYYRAFADGLKGLRIPVEPALARFDFDKKLPYRDTWAGGGYAGFDFGPFVGLRGFYFRGMKNGEVNLDFEELSIYGGELRMRANFSQGLTPTIILGGGYLDVGGQYAGRDSMVAKSQAFALGGLGLALPLSPRINVFGAARAMLTSNADPEAIESTDEIQTSWMYSAGLKLVFGKKEEAPEGVFRSEFENALSQKEAENKAKAEQLRAEQEQLKADYESKVLALEGQLNQAYAGGDVEGAAILLRKKQTAEEVLAELEKREAEHLAKAQKQALPPELLPALSQSRISLSPAEFESLLEEIMENRSPAAPDMGQALREQENERRLLEMEKMLVQLNERQAASALPENQSPNLQATAAATEQSAKLLAEIQRLNERIEKLEGGHLPEGEKEKDGAAGIPPAPSYPTVTEGNVLGVKTGGNLIQQDTGFFSTFVYEGMSGFGGFNVGGQLTANVGFRWHYGIGGSRFEFMPEAFFGFGSPASFGIMANVVMPVPVKKIQPVTPYIGTGVGFMQIAKNGDEKLRLNYNFIIGSYLNLKQGRVYVDLTARNLFKYNQLIIGYRFPF